MSQKYAVPCSCGASVAVEVRQAGDRATCPECTNSVEVPRLRALRTLPPLNDSADSVASTDATSWRGLPGAMFAAGMLVLAIAAGAAYYTHTIRTQYEVHTAPPLDSIRFEHDIQQISLLDSWDAWNTFKETKIASRQEPFHIFARGKVSSLNAWLVFHGVLGVLGIALIVVSLAIQRIAR